MAVSSSTNFPSCQDESGNYVVTQFVVEPRPAVDDTRRFGRVFLHISTIPEVEHFTAESAFQGVYATLVADMFEAKHDEELDAIIPGVVAAYKSLKTKNGMGIYTSNGAFYNHTFFGRDSAMAAKFVVDFDHSVARETIIALASLQGTKTDDITQEALGRIHHEYRDMTQWEGSGFERWALSFFLHRWGGSDKLLQTYYALDTTSLFIRLVNKYVHHVDMSLLTQNVRLRSGEQVTVEETLVRAANWITSQVNERGHLVSYRPNGWSLPYQTFQDSSTAFPRTDGSLANFKNGIAYTEAQAFAVDALEDVARLLEEHSERHNWQEVAHTMREALLIDFWDKETNFFGSAIDEKGLVDLPTVTAGWTLNTSLWHELPKEHQAETISAIVEKLFSDDFLTPVGLRSRALGSPQPLPGVVEYHGRLSVWPMFTFMVIEGLRRHNLHRLAAQLENRLINGLNANGDFEEYFVLDHDGSMLRAVPGKKATRTVHAQMLPEKNIAFTVIPAMVLAQRAENDKRAWPEPNDWQSQLEESVLARIDNVERLDPAHAHTAVPAVVPTKFNRLAGNTRSAWYFYRQWRRM